MVQLSIVIVNYNVKHFLALTLESVEAATKNFSFECIVVDNASQDQSESFITTKFPWVRWIGNHENKGFSVANNQGIALATGKYVLLLNPDTVLAEDSLWKSIDWLDNHPKAGALGIRMIDGEGLFLPESKRGLPTPEVAFYKAFGLSRIFPNSRRFGKYHLTYLNPHQNHVVDVLSGAFMMIRKEVLDRIGGLDERFFMYGEDVDLSYRIQLEGYENYYFSDSTIIHFKGESTKKGSLNYVRIFYHAMLLFADKHFSGKGKMLGLWIRLGVFLRGFMAVGNRLMQRIQYPMIDFFLILAGLHGIKEFWASYIKHAPEYYPPEYSLYILPLYTLLWMVAVFFSGGYDRPFQLHRLVRGIVTGTLLLAVLYAFLDEDLRFSRAMIPLGGIYSFLVMALVRRLFFQKSRLRGTGAHQAPRILIVAHEPNMKNIRHVLQEAAIPYRLAGLASPPNVPVQSPYLFGFDDLKTFALQWDIDEIIFSAPEVSYEAIIHKMQEIGPGIRFKFFTPGSDILLGSHSKDLSGELYSGDQDYKLPGAFYVRSKKMMEVLVALSLPLTGFWLLRRGISIHDIARWLRHLFSYRVCLIGVPKEEPTDLPAPEGIIPIWIKIPYKSRSTQVKRQSILLYLKDYHVSQDVRILWHFLWGSKDSL